MQMGFNNDVDYKDLTVHIQTEDHGLGSKKITSQVFYSGAILDSKTISYANDVAALPDDAARDERIRTLMKALHRKFYKRIHEGIYDAALPLESGPAPGASHLKVKASNSTVGLEVPRGLIAGEGFAIVEEPEPDAVRADKSRGAPLPPPTFSDAEAAEIEGVVDEIAAAASGLGQSGFVQIGGIGSGSHSAVTASAPPRRVARTAQASPFRGTARAYRGCDPGIEDGFGALLLEVLALP